MSGTLLLGLLETSQSEVIKEDGGDDRPGVGTGGPVGDPGCRRRGAEEDEAGSAVGEGRPAARVRS
jgi:hypothetical protein